MATDIPGMGQSPADKHGGDPLSQIMKDDTPWRVDIGGRPAWAECDGRDPRGSLSLRFTLEDLWKFQEASVTPGSRLRADIAHESGLYALDLVAEELTSANGELFLRASIKGSENHIQRRDAVRVRLLLDAQVEDGADDARQFEALVRDLSESGLRLSIPSTRLQVDTGSHVIVVFSTPSVGELRTDAEVRWKRPRIRGHEIGVRFAVLTSEQSMKLRRYVADIRRSRQEGA